MEPEIFLSRRLGECLARRDVAQRLPSLIHRRGNARIDSLWRGVYKWKVELFSKSFRAKSHLRQKHSGSCKKELNSCPRLLSRKAVPPYTKCGHCDRPCTIGALCIPFQIEYSANFRVPSPMFGWRCLPRRGKGAVEVRGGAACLRQERCG